MEDFGILWIWGFCGDSHRFFCGYGMGMGIKIPSPRQPWLLHSLLPTDDACSSSSLSTTVIKFSIDIIMKTILFVILNVSVCFQRGSVGVKILIPGGIGGLNEKKFPGSLSLAMIPLQHTFNFYPADIHQFRRLLLESIQKFGMRNMYQRLWQSQ